MSVKHHIGSSLNTGNSYYDDYTTTNAYVEKAFGFPAREVQLVNDSTTDTAQASWDGATLIGDLKPGESINLFPDGYLSIYIKATSGGDKVRIYSW